MLDAVKDLAGPPAIEERNIPEGYLDPYRARWPDVGTEVTIEPEGARGVVLSVLGDMSEDESRVVELEDGTRRVAEVKSLRAAPAR